MVPGDLQQDTYRESVLQASTMTHLCLSTSPSSPFICTTGGALCRIHDTFHSGGQDGVQLKTKLPSIATIRSFAMSLTARKQMQVLQASILTRMFAPCSSIILSGYSTRSIVRLGITSHFLVLSQLFNVKDSE